MQTIAGNPFFGREGKLRNKEEVFTMAATGYAESLGCKLERVAR